MGSPRPVTAAQPSPTLFFQTASAHQQSAALRAAIDLDLFTAIGEGNDTVAAIASRIQATERGTRILSDFLTIHGFLEKQDGTYRLTLDTATFLDRRSPAYLGSAIKFLNAPHLLRHFEDLTGVVRTGKPIDHEFEGVDSPMWVEFARSMAPIVRPAADWAAGIVAAEGKRNMRVLDIAAGHGLYGITIAKQMPSAEVVAVDWPNVLKVALENAAAAGVADRYRTVTGDAFEVDFGSGYDAALITNFLHHFDQPTCACFMAKVRNALKPGGRAILVEFVPNEDRVSPPMAATFAMIMLANTPRGDAYTYSQYQRMLDEAGFSSSELLTAPPIEQQIVVARV